MQGYQNYSETNKEQARENGIIRMDTVSIDKRWCRKMFAIAKLWTLVEHLERENTITINTSTWEMMRKMEGQTRVMAKTKEETMML